MAPADCLTTSGASMSWWLVAVPVPFLLMWAPSWNWILFKVSQGYYNTEVMLRHVGRHGGEISVCGTCMEARGISDAELTDTTHRSSLEELANWVQWADRTLVF